MLYKDHVSEQILEHSNLLIFWKDLDSAYLGCNRLFAGNAGGSSQSLVGKSDYDMPWRSLADQYRADDATAMKGTLVERLEKFVSADQKVQTVYVKKIPLRSDDRIIGMIGYTEILTNSLNATLIKVDKLNLSDSYFGITVRESHCLFYLIRGYKLSHIAHTLKIARRTVEKHIENMKAKFGCTSKSSLIEKALLLGFHRIQPPAL